MIEETRYEYGFSANTERIYKEYLHAYPPPHKRMQRWYEREYLFETGKTDWIFRGPLEKHKKILSDMTRENGLILSRGAELNIEALKELYLWFSSKVLTFDMSERPDWLMQATAQGLKKNKKLQDVALKLIRNADLGIDEISIVKKEKEKRGALATLFEQDFSLSKSDNYIIYTTHKISGSNKKEVFDLLKDESNGTKRYFALSIPFISVIYHGGVVLVDELDASMHPLLTRKLIEMFQIKQANKPGSQLIFSTHASEIMDPELFRRDQIWIVEKNKAGASELYSLYDFDPTDRPRNTEKFQRNYLAGRYGGVPKFGPIFEDLEFQ